MRRSGLLFALLIVCGVLFVSLPVRAEPQRLERSIVVDGRTRRYVAWIPSGATGRRLPLVLAFHGGGGDIEHFERTADLQDAPKAREFIIVYAAGFERTFNVGGSCCGAAAREHVDDVAFVRALLSDFAAVVPFDQRRVYATGFSNGGQFSYYLACTLSDRIAAIASVAGAMQPPFEACRPTRPVPVMHWAGLADRFDPFAGGASAIPTAPRQPPVMQGIERWRELDHAQTTQPVAIVGSLATCTESSGDPSGAVVILCTVADLGHQWPGTPPDPARPADRVLGPHGPAFDANDAVFTFFSRFALP